MKNLILCLLLLLHFQLLPGQSESYLVPPPRVTVVHTPDQISAMKQAWRQEELRARIDWNRELEVKKKNNWIYSLFGGAALGGLLGLSAEAIGSSGCKLLTFPLSTLDNRVCQPNYKEAFLKGAGVGLALGITIGSIRNAKLKVKPLEF